MGPELIAFLGGMAVALALAVGLTMLRQARPSRGRVEGGRVDVVANDAAAPEREARDQALLGQRDLVSLVDVMGIGVVRVADDQVIGLANHAAHVFLGAAPGSLVGRTALEAFIDHGVETILESARQYGSANGELAARDGERSGLVLRARRSLGEGVWLVLEDVTELRRLQRMRTEFVENLSHELRTPVTSVRLLAESLIREMDDAGASEHAREMLGRIDVETGHLAQMVTELLDLTKIEQGAAPLYLDDVDVRVVVHASIERLALFAERQGVALVADLPRDALWIRGDDDRLGQVLVNLLHNAVKFSSEGGQVTIRAQAVDKDVVVSVEDHGVGIPRADLGRVFERFYKVDKARVRGRGGTGLGLAIARHIVEGHGGRIWVESVEGAGSTFSFAVPRRDVAEAA